MSSGSDVDPVPFTPDEERNVRETYVTAGAAQCPRCDVTMRHRAMGGGSFGLGYARVRSWLLCPHCKQSVLFDAKRGTRT